MLANDFLDVRLFFLSLSSSIVGNGVKGSGMAIVDRLADRRGVTTTSEFDVDDLRDRGCGVAGFFMGVGPSFSSSSIGNFRFVAE